VHLSELEGLLGRHWPELLVDMDVWRPKTPLELLVAHPCPADVIAHRSEAREVMRRASRNTIKEEEVQRVLDSASRSVGTAASEEECEVIRAVAYEALHVRASIASIDKVIEKTAEEDEATRGIAEVVGRVTAVVLVAYLGPLSEYASPATLEKACGLNLKIKSSGNLIGRPSITKRGSSEARTWLYLAAVRLVKNEPLIAAWYRARSGYGGGRKLTALVAVMRKLARALWHVARGATFDVTKLVDARALPVSRAPISALAAPPTSRDAPPPLG
jgi:transposase